MAGNHQVREQLTETDTRGVRCRADGPCVRAGIIVVAVVVRAPLGSGNGQASARPVQAQGDELSEPFLLVDRPRADQV